MMISRRNFFSITIMMVVVTFLFMFSGAAKMALSNYQINEYAKVMHREVEPFSVGEFENAVPASHEGDFALYIGLDRQIRFMVQEWCRYNQLDLVTIQPGESECEDEESIADLVGGIPKYVMIDGVSITSKDADVFNLCINDGVPMIFCSMPSPGYLSANTSVANMMGISKLQSNAVKITGMHLYSGLLMGGDYVYEPDDREEEKEMDLLTNVPWYILASASKVYMDGIYDKSIYDEIDNAYKPPIIWRYNTGKNYVFAVNADFMKDPTALGILTGFMCETEPVTIYPIVNAQSFVLNNYPAFTNENEGQMRTIYSRDAQAVLRDLIWPTIVSIREKTGVVPSLMYSAKINYSSKDEPDPANLDYFMQLMREQRMEAGLSLISADQTDPKEKLIYDLEFFKSRIPDYEYQMAYIGDLDTQEARKMLDDAGQENIATLLRDYSKDQEIIIGYEEGYAVISTVNKGTRHTYRDDLLMRSIETALGYAVISEDLGRVVYPSGGVDEWQNVSKSLAGNTVNYWKPYDELKQTTISEAGDRARMFLDLKYNVSIDDKVATIDANLKDMDDAAYFIFKAPKNEVTAVVGGAFYEIEDGTYLIEVHKDKVSIYYRSVQDSKQKRVLSQEEVK